MLGFRYRKANPTEYVLHYEHGKLRREGAGLSCLYFAPSSTIVSVPLSSTNVPFVFTEPTADFQTLTVQGQLTFRVADPKKAAAMLDFSLDARGRYASDQHQKLPERLVYGVQTLLRAEIQARALRTALTAGDELAALVLQRVASSPEATSLGIEILNVAILSLAPTPDMARALEAEARESLNRAADEAVYARRNAAIEQERRIKENELQTELLVQAKQRELQERELATAIALETERGELIEKKVANERLDADAKAYALRALVEPIAGLDWRMLMMLGSKGGDPRNAIAMAFTELAANAGKIGELNVSPDLLRSLIGQGSTPRS